MTRAERVVLRTLEGGSAFRSAQELHAELRAGGDSVGLTSVYRALQSLVAAGAVDVVRTPTGEATYRRCDTDRHHHHLLCRECGATVEVEAPALERWVREIAARHGYTVDSHTLELAGVCRSCRPG